MNRPSGSGCVSFVTIALGTEIIISNIFLAIHIRPPYYIDEYLQDIRRIGINEKKCSSSFITK